jgi:hypothetical protein
VDEGSDSGSRQRVVEQKRGELRGSGGLSSSTVHQVQGMISEILAKEEVILEETRRPRIQESTTDLLK